MGGCLIPRTRCPAGSRETVSSRGSEGRDMNSRYARSCSSFAPSRARSAPHALHTLASRQRAAPPCFLDSKITTHSISDSVQWHDSMTTRCDDGTRAAIATSLSGKWYEVLRARLTHVAVPRSRMPDGHTLHHSSAARATCTPRKRWRALALERGGRAPAPGCRTHASSAD